MNDHASPRNPHDFLMTQKTARRPGDPAGLTAVERRDHAVQLVDEVAPVIGVVAACAALDVPRATVYRHRAAAKAPIMVAPPRASPRALDVAERSHVLDVLSQPQHADLAVAQVYASLLDRSVYLCSIRTM
jgi:putative transposase